jgi:hypothetical protein
MSVKTHSRACLGMAAPILVATAGTAAANPIFSINANLSTPAGVQSVIGSQGAPIADNRNENTGIPGAAVSVAFGAVAAPGVLGSLSTVAALAPGSLITGSDNSVVDFALDNLKIVDPNLAAGTPVLYTINFKVGGSIVVAAFGDSSANADVQLNYFATPVNGVTLGTAFASTLGGGASGGSGIFSAGVSDVSAHTPLALGVVGQEAYAEFILATHAGATAAPSPNEQGQASASSDFLDPFSFPTDGPVFNFFDANGDPLAGVTVDSGDGCIVDNRFLCGGVPTPTPVPEPCAWAMLLVGFAGLGYRWRPRKGSV